MRVMITGGGGLLARALAACAPQDAEVSLRSHSELDIADASVVSRELARERPEVVINAAAYTQVDTAETETSAAERSNAIGATVLAAACRAVSARLVHVSTDYVFDGSSSSAWQPTDVPQPLNVYGASKRRGELGVIKELGKRALIVRSSWLYGATGRNILTRLIGLAAARPSLTIVADQIGAPTSLPSLAGALWDLAAQQNGGVFHWTDSGVASWYDFAVAAAEEAVQARLLPRMPEIVAISSDQYPTAARRPRFSVLDKRSTEALIGRQAPHWRSNLRLVIADIARGVRG